MFQAVPKYVSALTKVLQTTVPLSASAGAAVQSEALRLVSLARRLRVLPTRLAAIPDLNATLLRKSMRSHGVDPKFIIDRHGQLVFGVEHVGLFLDVAEGLYFEDDLTGEERRADRYSRRP
jgi:hypothetical protein